MTKDSSEGCNPTTVTISEIRKKLQNAAYGMAMKYNQIYADTLTGKKCPHEHITYTVSFSDWAWARHCETCLETWDCDKIEGLALTAQYKKGEIVLLPHRFGKKLPYFDEERGGRFWYRVKRKE
jgi:hypothetical protein